MVYNRKIILGKEKSMEPKYKRVVLKISGEALAGEEKFGINEDILGNIAKQVQEVYRMGASGYRRRGRQLLARQNQQEHGQGDG